MQKSLAATLGVLACFAVPAAASAADRDHDRLPDRWERQYHLSTHAKSAAGDPDRDGVSNLREYRNELNPRRRDTDRDGISDGTELRTLTLTSDAKTSGSAKPIKGPKPKPAPPTTTTTTPTTTTDTTPTTTTTIPTTTTTVPTTTTTVPTETTPTTTTPTTTTPTTTTTTPTTTTEEPPPPPPAAERYAPCTQTVSSASSAVSAIGSASAGAVICLANGTYGSMSIPSNKSGEVTLRAQNPGSVTVGQITVSGSRLKLAGLRFVNSTVQLNPPAHHIVIENNYFSGGYFGVDMASADASISDITIRGSKFVGGFGEDAIRANRYHDGDGDGIGLLVEGNEFTKVVQLGGSSAAHADLLQSVWGGDHLVFRKNYAHDNRAENLFVKDQPSQVNTVVMEDNLLIRNGVASDGAGQPAIVNLYSPTTNLVVRRNTIWDTQGSSPIAWQGGSWGSIVWEQNLLYRAWGSGSGGSWTLSNNTYCDWTGTLPSPGAGATKVCSPLFSDTATDDYRLLGSDRGVTWRPADQVYGT
jgi:hypothetical protein